MKYIILATCILCSLGAYSQNNNNNIVSDSAKKKEFLALKSIALCKCLIDGFPSDSLRSKDQSMYILLDIYHISYDFVDAVSLLSDKFMVPYRKDYKRHEGMHSPRVMMGCIDFYNSKELDLFVHRYLRQHLKDIFDYPPGSR